MDDVPSPIATGGSEERIREAMGKMGCARNAIIVLVVLCFSLIVNLGLWGSNSPAGLWGWGGRVEKRGIGRFVIESWVRVWRIYVGKVREQFS